MPGRNNKKKANKRATRAPRTTSNGTAFPDRVLPSFHGGDNGTSSLSERRGGIYEIYKTATESFVNWVKSNRNSKMMRSFTVNDLAERAVQIDAHNVSMLQDDASQHQPITAPPVVLRDLEISIQYRQIMAGKHGDHEEGHAYFIQVLKQFRKVLRRGHRVARIMNYNNEQEEDDDDPEIEELNNRFIHLAEDDDPEEEDITEEDLRRGSVPAVTIPEPPAKVPSLEDLIAGSDRMQAVALLLSMESLMEQVDESYRTLKSALALTLVDGLENNQSYMQLLLECGMVANYATVSVRVMENSLQLDHPHLSTSFHILSILFLDQHIHKFQCWMPNHILQKNPHLGLDYAADVMESMFCRKPFGKNQLYARKAGIDVAQLEFLGFQIQAAVMVEAALDIELPGVAEAIGRNHRRTWLQDKRYIGGNRSIINTMVVSQRAFVMVSGNGRLYGKPGSFGPIFDESNKVALSIRGDLDDLFASTILPEVICLAQWAPFHLWPQIDRLAPTLDLLSKQAKLPRPEPIKMALAFGLHAMLTSVFVLQGNVLSLAEASKKSFHQLFDQWQPMLQRSNGSPEHASNFYSDLSKFRHTQGFATPVSERNCEISENTENLALWNPFISAQYLLFATYMCSIGVGSAMVDDIAQLRTTMHLYNALRTTNLLSAPIPLLEMLSKNFSRTKHLWATREPPSKGSFLKEYLLSFGASIDMANRLSTIMVLDGKGFKKARSGMRRSVEVDDITPQDFSESYPRLVMADFSVNDVHETVERNNREDVDVFVAQVSIARDAMKKDASTVLPINFPVVSDILLGFVHGLAERLDWGSQILDIAGRDRKENPSAPAVVLRNQAIMQLVSRNLLADLDKDATDTLCEQAADYMRTYFEGISPSRFLIFVEPTLRQRKLSSFVA